MHPLVLVTLNIKVTINNVRREIYFELQDHNYDLRMSDHEFADKRLWNESKSKNILVNKKIIIKHIRQKYGLSVRDIANKFDEFAIYLNDENREANDDMEFWRYVVESLI